jgi:hypothetical protein
VLAEALRVNNTLAVLKLYYNDLGEGGRRALAETLRLNTTVTSLNLRINGRKRAEGAAGAGTEATDTACQHHAHVAQPLRQLSGRGRRAGAGRGTARRIGAS